MHFAAVVGYVPPHCPFVAPEDLFDYYYDRVNVPTQPTADEQPAASRMIRRGRWKLHKYADDTPPVLFDLEADPRELDDCGGDPAWRNFVSNFCVPSSRAGIRTSFAVTPSDRRQTCSCYPPGGRQ